MGTISTVPWVCGRKCEGYPVFLCSKQGKPVRNPNDTWNTDDSIAPLLEASPPLFITWNWVSSSSKSSEGCTTWIPCRSREKDQRTAAFIEGFDGLKVTRFWHHGECSNLAICISPYICLYVYRISKPSIFQSST